MPKLAIYKNLIFFFVSFDLSERRHLHVVNRRNYKRSAKIWLDNGTVFEKGLLTDKELRLACKLINGNIEAINEEIDKFMIGKKTRVLKLTLK